MVEKRLNYIDFLKFIGLTGIIIAHVNCPNWLLMLRNFDVPLMVIISAYLGARSINKYDNNLKYYISRIKRLIIPTYIFLILFFIYKFIISNELMESKYYIDSFLLTRYGIGFVWIILIYLYSSLLLPLFKKIGYNYKTIIVLLIIYLLYELCCHYEVGMSNKIIETTFYYIIPYGILTYIGFNLDNIKNSKKILLIILNIIIFISLGLYLYNTCGSFQNVQVAKYPARLYYLSYGLLCSLLLFIVCSKFNFKNKIITFISKHSLWIYLWHIFYLDLYDYLKLYNKWYIKFIIVYLISIITIYLINKLLDLIDKNHKYNFLNYLRY